MSVWKFSILLKKALITSDDTGLILIDICENH